MRDILTGTRSPRQVMRGGIELNKLTSLMQEEVYHIIKDGRHRSWLLSYDLDG